MSKKLEPGMAYDTKKLNKVFAFLSILFLMTVVWVFLDDFIRPWKAVQLKGNQIKKAKLEKSLAEAQKGLDKDKLAKLETQLAEGKKIVQTRQKEISKVQKKLDAVRVKIKGEVIINGRLNSNVSATGFNYGIAHANHDKSEKELFKKLRKYKKEFAASSDRLKKYKAEEKVHVRAIAALRKEVLENEKGIKDLTSKIELTKLALKKLEINPIFVVRNSPFVDFLDPTLKIQQVVMDNITDDRYFQHVPKVDRCMTCHMFIDKEGYEDQENPYKSHPKLDLMVGRDSKHPMKTYGCTSCHGGEGHRVNDFSAAAHTPRNDEQLQEWIEKYNYHPPHKIAKPMFKVGETEAGCVNCHKEVEFIPGADKVNEGRMAMEKYGCYGCHKIEGWEHKRKPGPSLEKIASKVTKEFFKNWVWEPKRFNKHAMMPSFFGQSNNSEPRFMKKNIAEVNAMAEFIWSKSERYTPFMKYTGGNKDKGKELVSTVGCMGCHGVEGFDEASKKVGAYAGPYLTGTGSKVDADWLVSWLKKPSHYQEDTIMPSFRLSDREVNDITAYLMSLRNKKFEKLKFEPLDGKLRDEMLVTYLSAFDTIAVAKEKLSKMSEREKTLELGYRSVGKYGCYSCHNIDGFEGRTPIGPELTNIGSKPLTQFGFGHEHDVEHSRGGWIRAHLINPKRWDNGADKPFKDLLRMPNLYMTEDEADKITVALLGQVSDYIPLAGVKRLDANEKIANEGMKIVNKYNCVGCHKVDGFRGDIMAMYDDANEAPPMLVDQGHRVQADWFHHFLENVYPIRPWLSLRMPSFNLSNEERNKIVQLFQYKAHQNTFVDHDDVVKWEPGEREGARKLFKSLDCASCHAAGFNNEEPTAPNLYFVKRRLRPTWTEKWLRNPQAIFPETVMPNFWEDGESTDTEVFGGDADKQIKALTKYLYELGTMKLPDSNTKYWSKQ
ncbi:MAG: c-type cytochrome [Oligoflexia bacterium]|nr:c-type cytochrome [Oligoflexia bacterium]